MFRTVILDELKMRSDSYKMLISESFKNVSVHTCNNEPQFTSHIGRFTGDVLIYCSSRVLESSKDCIKMINGHALGNRTIIITNKISGWVTSNLKTLGIYGYVVMEDNSNNVLVTAMKHILDNKPYYCPKVCQAIAGSHVMSPAITLTERERQIALLISKDLSSIEIADELCLSPYTVSSYRKNILKKINVKTSGGLIRRLSEFDFF